MANHQQQQQLLLLQWLVLVGAAAALSIIPTTLDGPTAPVTIPLDESFRGHARDLPDSDQRVRRQVTGLEPDQISVSLSSSFHSIWISWATGEYQIGDNIKPLDPTKVTSIVEYGTHSNLTSHTKRARGHSLVYNQLYRFQGLQNYTSPIIHHVLLKGGNQREKDRERAAARGGKNNKKDDGLTPEQRRERDAKALQEKTAKKAAGSSSGDAGGKTNKK